MISRKKQCMLVDFPVAKPEMYFREAQLNYLGRLRSWLGSTSPVVGHHTSKSVQLPLVRAASGVLLGYNFYDYVCFIPRAVWKRFNSRIRSAIPGERMRWHTSFTSWKPGRGEVLLTGHQAMVTALLEAGLLRPETDQIRAQLRASLSPKSSRTPQRPRSRSSV